MSRTTEYFKETAKKMTVCYRLDCIGDAHGSDNPISRIADEDAEIRKWLEDTGRFHFDHREPKDEPVEKFRKKSQPADVLPATDTVA